MFHRVGTQEAEVGDHFLKVFECARYPLFPRTAAQVDIKQVLKRGSGIRPRLDLQQVDISQAEDTQDSEEYADPVHGGGESNAALYAACASAAPRLPSDDEESCEVVRQIFQIPLENL